MNHHDVDAQDTTENQLLEIIQRHLPLVEQKRLDYLLEKNETDKLTEAEQKEFLAYANRRELEDADRLEALVKLAQLRNLEPKTLFDEFFPEK